MEGEVGGLLLKGRTGKWEMSDGKGERNGRAGKGRKGRSLPYQWKNRFRAPGPSLISAVMDVILGTMLSGICTMYIAKQVSCSCL